MSANSFSRDRGLAAENACAEWLARRGWAIIERRLKTPFAEIDLVASESVIASPGSARDPIIWHAIEVKSISQDAFVLHRVGHRQRERLLRGRAFLQDRHRHLVTLDLMTVDERGHVEFFGDFLS